MVIVGSSVVVVIRYFYLMGKSVESQEKKSARECSVKAVKL